MNKIHITEKTVKLALITLLAFNIVFSLFNIMINPEIYLLGKKFGGYEAECLLVSFIISSLVIIVLLLRNYKYAYLISFVYFAILEILMLASPLFLLGLVISILGLILKHINSQAIKSF